MERRHFVKLSAFTAVALGLPFAQGCSTPPAPIALARPWQLLQLIDDDNAIKQAGRAYIKAHAAEGDKQKLTQLLLGKNNAAAFTEAQMQTLLDKQVTVDFKQGNTLVVNGWVMALTEARQCALYSILKP